MAASCRYLTDIDGTQERSAENSDLLGSFDETVFSEKIVFTKCAEKWQLPNHFEENLRPGFMVLIWKSLA